MTALHSKCSVPFYPRSSGMSILSPNVFARWTFFFSHNRDIGQSAEFSLKGGTGQAQDLIEVSAFPASHQVPFFPSTSWILEFK